MPTINKLPKDLTDDQVTTIALKLRSDFNNDLSYWYSQDEKCASKKNGMTFEERQAFIQQIKDYYQAIRETI
jgi:hypothetical protein